ncbi:hypothetical protein AAZX31_12G114000 [Glycine max]
MHTTSSLSLSAHHHKFSLSFPFSSVTSYHSLSVAFLLLTALDVNYSGSSTFYT